MKCLWISRDLPFPLDAGDRIYSANMASALSEAGVAVHFLGYADEASYPPASWPVDAHVIKSEKLTPLLALLSRLPLAAAIHDTQAYRELLEEQLLQRWDVIVIDSYGSGWALDTCLRARERFRDKPPAIVYLSHNHEAQVWRSMVNACRSNPLRRIALWQNWLKVRALENRLVQSVDLIATITPEDACALVQEAGAKPTVVLTPGYSGWVAPERRIDEGCPQHVVLVGSFRWVVKQENLRRFLEFADARFQQHNIVLDVIGDVPRNLLDEFSGRLRATHFHGFVNNIEPFFANARMAVVPEMIGGGFKLKFLDYIFGRVPVATISEAASCLPEAIRDNMLCRRDMQQLVDGIVDYITAPERLDAMQKQAFTAAQAHFRWQDRGHSFRAALEHFS